ncbi:N-acyl homoserine lactonase family protein [Aurantivibrio plasticivorans]
MQRLLMFAAACAFSAGCMSDNTVDLSLTRLDCGSAPEPSNVSRFSDAYDYRDTKIQFTYSCYLIKHGENYLMWDAGNPDDGSPRAPQKNLVTLLGELNIKPNQIDYLALSHYHGDHIGQSYLLPNATLLVGQGDWDALSGQVPNRMANAAPIKHWVDGNGKVDVVAKDKDIFGDGTVIMLGMPGHTPGHSALLVKLKTMGYVLLSGDLAHFHENYDNERVPSFNTNRADTLASFDRFKDIAKNLNATVIIQHDARDIDKLPSFPQAAR